MSAAFIPLADIVQIVLAGCALWLAWETRGLRRATFALLTETQRASRVGLTPYLFLEVDRDAKTGFYRLNLVNESTALAVQVDCFIYDSANKHYLQFLQLTHSKPSDDDEPELLRTFATAEEATARVVRRNPGVGETAIGQIIACGSRSAAIAFFQDVEQRLYATRRFFSEEQGTIVHLKQERLLLSRVLDGRAQ